MTIETRTDAITDFVIHFPGVEVGVKTTCLLSGELYLWARLEKFPKLSVYKQMRRMLDSLEPCPHITCQVLKSQPKAESFARFFGFKTVYGVDDILVMELS